MGSLQVTTNKSKEKSQMTYNHLTISELSFIQNFWSQGTNA